MEDLIESIRLAIAPDATDEARAEGATACRSILSALEAKPGEPLATPAVPAMATVPSPEAVASIVGALRSVPPEQLLDLAIARLRAALPPGQAAPAVQPVKFQLVPIPRRG
ncbi:MAG TPA: hypothetical protein VFQ53_04580 [Kofleriaceae bacterium]|nr:hypothetical protein [Kofleriaceae bacterium]